MRTLLILITVALLAGCADYTTNEKTLAKIKFREIFAKQHMNYSMNEKGHSLSAGSSMGLYEYDSIFIIKGRQALPDNWLIVYARAIKQELETNGATVISCKETCSSLYAKDYKQDNSESLGAKIVFSISGSRGIINLRYTTVKLKDQPQAIGYLNIDLVEFR